MDIALAQSGSGIAPVLRPLVRSFQAWTDWVGLRSRLQKTFPIGATPPIYQIVDRLHEQRTVHVAGDAIAPTVAGWLAELGVQSPMADDLAKAVRSGDWHAVYAIGEHLSVGVTVAATAGHASRRDPAGAE
jgi:hypothetical protein